MLKLKLPILWSPDVKNSLIGEDPDVGKDWRQKEKGTAEDKMFRWYYWVNGQEFEQALGDGEGQGSLVCCSPWGHKQLDTTKWLNNNNKYVLQILKCLLYDPLQKEFIYSWFKQIFLFQDKIKMLNLR